MRGKGGQAPPSGTPPLFGTFGAPAVRPFGALSGVRGRGKINSHARAEPLLAATLGLFVSAGHAG